MSGVLRFLRGGKAGAIADFDHEFYAQRYPDLRQFGDRKRLLRHYVDHGMREGRFRSLRDAKEHFRAKGVTLPAGFNTHVYRSLNRDLQLQFTWLWQFELHYLAHGATEGRPYGADAPGAGEAWRTLFNLYDFKLFSQDWRPEGDIDLAEALRLFERQGIERLVPVALDYAFDAAFYAGQYGFHPSMAPADLYAHWLRRGFAAGHEPNETRLVFPYMQGRPYPAGFDWRAFAGSRAAAAGQPARTDALVSLFERPLDDASDRCVQGPEAATLHRLIGDYKARGDDPGQALAAYRRCEALGGGSAALDERVGAASEARGDRGEALVRYRSALQAEPPSARAAGRLVRLLMGDEMFEQAFGVLDAHVDLLAGDPLFKRLVEDYLAARYDRILADLRSMIGRPDAAQLAADPSTVERANRAADAAFEAYAREVGRLKVSPGRDGGTGGSGASGSGASATRVVMLACLDLEQCRRYRVEQRSEQLSLLGIAADVHDGNDPVAFMQSLPGAAVAIFYRVPNTPLVVEAMLYARFLGVTTFYDIDDLIFTRDFPDSYASYDGLIPPEDYLALQVGVPSYRHAISLCDYGLASTEALAARLAGHVRCGQAFVVRNGLDALSMAAMARHEAKSGAHDSRDPADVVIFYGTGTKAHGSDFHEGVAAALIATLDAHPGARLVVVGHLALRDDFRRFAARVETHPFVPDVAGYYDRLAGSDINISVLADNAQADCKSEIKWLEAALFGIPSIVPPTATFRAVVEEGVDGLFARSTGEWTEALRSLVEDAALRRSIGATARDKALRDYGTARVSGSLLAALEAVRPQAPRPPARKRRILVCNVFFAPQSYGGATRVVEDNVDHAIEHAETDIEVSILATDYGVPAGRLRVERYKGCRLFRISTPDEPFMDWRPFNPRNAELFERVLDLVEPDLVHVHCIQRLTASLLTTCERRAIPFIVTLHDCWWLSDYQFLVDGDGGLVDVRQGSPAPEPPPGLTRAQSRERDSALRRLLSLSRCNLAVSASLRDLYAAAGIGRLQVVANGLAQLPPKLATRRHDAGLVLGHIGGRLLHKGASLLEFTVKTGDFANLRLLMIDSSVEPGSAFTQRWGATEVVLQGVQPQAGVNALYAAFDVLVAPSLWPESYGLVTREALFYDKWVIASDRGAIGEDLVEGVNGFVVDVADSKALAAVLRRLNEEPQRFKSPPAPRPPQRTSAEQGAELVALYRALCPDARSPAAV